jgi:hypothetical protein
MCLGSNLGKHNFDIFSRCSSLWLLHEFSFAFFWVKISTYLINNFLKFFVISESNIKICVEANLGTIETKSIK